VIVGINLIGLLAVLVIANFVVPIPTPRDVGHVRLVDAIVAAGYFALAARWAPFSAACAVSYEDVAAGGATDHARGDEVGAARAAEVVHRAAHLLGGRRVLFGVLNYTYSHILGVRVAIIVTLTGW